MVAMQVLLEIPPTILKGLQNGTYERIGGVIREVGSKQVVAWLRETSGATVLSGLGSGIPGVDLVNGVITNLQLRQANLRLAVINQNVQQTLGLTQLNTAIGLANLGISTIGFAIIIYKLNQIEKKISQIQSEISNISHKIDSSFYAKIKAAVDISEIALKMSTANNRRRVITEVIQPLIEAQHYYQSQCDFDWENQDGVLGREHICILSLAYITEAKCYLELGESQIAIERLSEGTKVLQPRIKRYVKQLLSEDPSGYLHPACKDVNLSSIVDILRWVHNKESQDEIFNQYLRKSIYNSQDIESWVNALPLRSRNAILVHVAPDLVGQDWNMLAYLPWNASARKESIVSLMSQSHHVMDVVQSMIELDKRLESYRYEIEGLTQLGLTYPEWRELVPLPTTASHSSKVVMLLPSPS